MKILLSYTNFTKKNAHTAWHTANLESTAMIESLVDLGLEVSWIYTDNCAEDSEILNYDLIIGEGASISRALQLNNRKCKIVFYATTQNPLNLIRGEYISAIKQSSGLGMKNMRSFKILQHFDAFFCDAIICLGNYNTKLTYEDFKNPVYSIYPSGFQPGFAKNITINKDAKKLVFFSGGGASLKGLFHLLKFIDIYTDFRLLVFGPTAKEIVLEDLYKRNAERISLCEHVVVPSPLWFELVQSSYFALFPSFSDGCSTSLLTCLRSGLIPIASKGVGLDISGLGFELRENSFEDLNNTILNASNLSRDKLDYLSNYIFQNCSQKFSIENYKKNITHIFKIILDRL